MRDNINKVAERGERLDSLESKTGRLPSPLSRSLFPYKWKIKLIIKTILLLQHRDSDVVQIVSGNKCGGRFSFHSLITRDGRS
jgi:hypothetical protein